MQWWYFRSEQWIGPYSEQELGSLIQAGEIAADCPVREGRGAVAQRAVENPRLAKHFPRQVDARGQRTAPTKASGYFLKRGKKVWGPVSAEEILDQIYAGSPPPSDVRIGKSTTGPWHPIRWVPRLAEAIADAASRKRLSNSTTSPAIHDAKLDGVTGSGKDLTHTQTMSDPTNDGQVAFEADLARIKPANSQAIESVPEIPIAATIVVPASTSRSSVRLTRRNQHVALVTIAAGSFLALFVTFTLYRYFADSKSTSERRVASPADQAVRRNDQNREAANPPEPRGALPADRQGGLPRDDLAGVPAADLAPKNNRVEPEEREHPEQREDGRQPDRFADTADLTEYVDQRHLRVEINRAGQGVLGSGFVVSADGLAVTNHHVIEGGRIGRVVLADGRRMRIDGVRYYDIERDIAVIQLSVGSMPLKKIQVAATLARKGEVVFAFGNPQGLAFSVSDGIVSAIRQAKDIVPFPTREGTWLQTTAPLSEGNSGGPLVNRNGEVVAMNTLVRTSGQNLNFAISSLDIAEAIEKAEEAPLIPMKDVPSKVQVPDDRDREFGEDLRVAPGFREFEQKIRSECEDRINVLNSIESEAAELLSSLKKAMLDGNALETQQVQTRIKALRDIASSHVTRRFECLPRLDPDRLRVGITGTLERNSIQILQIIDGEHRTVLARFLTGLNHHPAFFRGINTDQVEAGDIVRFPDGLGFLVDSIRELSLRNGRDTSAFQLICLGYIDEYRRSLVQRFEALVWEPAFTEEEKLVLEQTQMEQARLAREAAAQSKLELAIRLIGSGKKEEAKKWLREIISNAASTTAAKTASSMLERLEGRK